MATLTPPPGIYQVDFGADTLVGNDHAEYCRIQGASAGGGGFSPTPPIEVAGGPNGELLPVATNGIVNTTSGSRSSIIEVVCKESGAKSTFPASVWNVALTADQLTEENREGSAAKLDRRPVANRFVPSPPGRLAREWLKQQGR